MNDDLFTFNRYVGPSEVLQGRNDGDAGCVDKAAIVVKKVDVYTDLPTLLSGDDAEGFGIDGTGATNSLFD